MQFKIGQVYTTSQNQSFSIKIIRRTEKQSGLKVCLMERIWSLHPMEKRG